MPTAIIPAEAEALDVSLFPNPVSDKITIAMKDGGKDVAPFLYDHTGRMLDRYAPGANRQTIDMQGRPSGIYFMRLYGKDGRTAQRKILKR